MTDDLHATLTRSTLFRGVAPSLVSAVAARCEAVLLAAGEKLLVAGKPNTKLYLIHSGALSNRTSDAAPHPRLAAGECVADMSLLDGRPVSADIVADESSVLIAFDQEQLWSLIDASPEMARNLLRTLAGRSPFDAPASADSGAVRRQFDASGTVDGLTGLRNRRWLNDAFARQLERTARAALPASILLIDLDHLRRLNDEHGRLVGDALLCRAAQVLTDGLRPQDLVARYTGGTFAVLLPELDASAAIAVAERLRRLVESDVSFEEGQDLPRVTISIGGTTRRPFESLPDLLSRAESSLERAKQAGRNRTSE